MGIQESRRTRSEYIEWDVAQLRDDHDCKKRYCKRLDTNLKDLNPDGTLEDTHKNIINAIHTALDSEVQNEKEFRKPWESEELLILVRNSNNTKVQREEIIKLKKKLKNKFYEKKANELNAAHNARRVEREFALAKKYGKRNEIKLTILGNHFQKHFKKRDYIEMPDELIHSENYPDLFNDEKLEINENPPDREEIRAALASLKNGKSFGTDKIPTEGLKYGNFSNHLITAIWLLLTCIWTTMTIPTEWLNLSNTCLYKKGCKQLATNYRALSVGSNISKILPKIILTRLMNVYEQSISKAQFGFRKDRSTTDAVFSVRQTIKNTEGTIIAVYIDLTAAFDKVPRHIMLEVLKIRTGCKKLIDILWLLYDGTTGKVRGDGNTFPTEAGTRQGGIESPPVFNWFFDWVLKVAASEIDQRLDGEYLVSTELEMFATKEALNE